MRSINKKIVYFIVFVLIALTTLVGVGIKNNGFNILNNKKYSDPLAVDNNWNVSMNFIDDGTLLEELDWHAEKASDTKNIIIQFNYRNNNAVQSYEPGDLKIKISNGLKDYKGKVINIVSSSTGEDAEQFDWKLVSSGEEIVLTNNIHIDESVNFEGSVQIAFRPDPLKVVSGSSFNFKGYFSYGSEENLETNELVFNFTSSRDTFDYSVNTEKMSGLDGLPENADDYIWVKNTLYFEKKGTGVRDVKLSANRWNYARDVFNDNSFYFLQYVPNNALVYDQDLNPLTVTDGKVRVSDWRYLWYKMYTYVIVGYPKSEYEHSTIQSKSEVHGIFWDEDEDTLISTKTVNLNLDDFSFEYDGEGDGGLYKVSDKMSDISLTKASTIGSNATYVFQLTYNWGGEKEDIEIGDDYLYALDRDQNYVRLTNEEYHFTKVIWYGSKLYNSNEKRISPYDLELWVRFAGSDSYEKYGNTLKANVDNTVSFKSSENVAAYKWIIKDVNESIKPDMNSTQAQYYGYVITMSASLKIKKNDLNSSSKVYNFAYIKLYQNGEWINQKELTDYSEGVTRNNIAPMDFEEHGGYLARTFASEKVLDNAINFSVTKKASNNSLLENNPSEENYIGKYSITTKMGFGYGYTDSFKGVVYYDLLPKGMNFSEVSSVNVASEDFKNNIKTSSGNNITDEYLLDHFKTEVQENYNGTGRTLVKLYWDFTDDPLDLSIDKIKNGTLSTLYLPTFVMDVFVPYESFLESGNVYNNTIYMKPLDMENIDYIPYTRIDDYNGVVRTLKSGDTTYALKESIDLDGNGELNYMFTASAKLEVLELFASHQDLLTLVETNQSNFNSKKAFSSNSAEYLYKLRIRPSNNDITNLIIYDNIESAYGDNEYWRGTFNGVDTSYAGEQGYNVKVYYSDNPSAGSLSSDSSWKVYDDNVDNGEVKSVAFEFLDDEGNYAYIPAKSYTYVIIKMVAPENKLETKAYNNSWTEWKAYKGGNLVVGADGLLSNVVEVNLPLPESISTAKDIDPETGKPVTTDTTVSPNTIDNIIKVVIIALVVMSILIISYYKMKKAKQSI